MSVRQAARKAGITPTYWSKIEAGSGDIALAAMLRIQRVFDLPTIEELLGGIDFASRRVVDASPEQDNV
jgi:transcriptional regulator with XRE-family HTH domain